MATITLPLHCQSAHGSIAKSITFRQTHGQTIATHYNHPRNKPTPDQLEIRTRTKLLMQLWPTLTPYEKSTWLHLAEIHSTTPIIAFFTTNWTRLLHGQSITLTPSGLTRLAYYPLDDNAPNPFITDESGYNLHGTAHRDTNLTYDPAGKISGCYHANGTTDYITLGTQTPLNTTTGTWAVWAKSNDPTSADQVILIRQNTYPGTVNIRKSSYGGSWPNKWIGQIRLKDSESTYRLIQSDDIATSDWTHLALTYDGNCLKLYINGVLQTDTYEITGTIDTSNFSSFYIAKHSSTNQFFNGRIDDLRIFNKALTNDQIQDLL